jgi:histidyl-tRNA synthetase
VYAQGAAEQVERRMVKPSLDPSPVTLHANRMAESVRSKGMRDMLPADMTRFRRIEAAFRDVCLGWGYQEVRTPTVEHLFLFTQAGTLSPQMLDRVYSFLDWDGWSGERVVLRPDSTIPTVRLFLENMGEEAGAKLFYVQNVFRFEQGDVSREDWQCGVELLGDAHEGGDVELIIMADEALGRLGITSEVKLSHPGIVRAILDKAGLSHTEQLALYDRILEGDMSTLDEVERRLPGGSSIRGLLTAEGEGAAFLQNLQTVLGRDIPAIEEPIRELSAVSRMLTEVDQAHRIAPLGVRNFEYYTGPVFTLFAGGRRVGGGGRYDALAQLVGQRSVPASGFALEMEVVSELLEEREDAAPTVTIRPENAGSIGRAFALAVALRRTQTSVALTRSDSHAPHVVVSSTTYVVATNGSSPQELTEIADVIRAITGG